MMNMERQINHDYMFDDFLLNSSGVLSFHGQEIAVPPKELHVLITLLEAKGQLVHKNLIIDKVWGDHLVGDESLTRCIYSLRRLLRESKTNKYIDTVYGKGYRFSKPVTVMQHQRQTNGRSKLAVFPFRGAEDAELALLHALLLDRLIAAPSAGLSMVPALLTRDRSRAEDILTLCHQLELDFYLSGEFRSQQRERVLVVELVEASSQHLLWRDTLKLDGCANWSERIEILAKDLPAHLPLPAAQALPASSNEVLMSHVMARRCLRVRQPGDLNLALQYLQMGLVQDPLHVPSLTACAETYLALAMQGEIWPQSAFLEARNALDKALSLAPNYPAAQGVMGWLLCLSQTDQTEAAQCLRLAVNQPEASAEVYLYQALQLSIQGAFEYALQALNHCLTLDGHLPAALILKLWLLHAMDRSDEALAYGLSLAGQRSLPPRFYSVLALLLSHAGQPAKAIAYANMALEMAPDSLPEQIHHAMVECARAPERTQQRLALWREQAEARYRCPGLLAALALDLNDTQAVRALLILARQQHCVWLPLVSVSPRMARFLAQEALR